MTQSEKMVFCTLFDSNYLDKGLALYWSMKKHIRVFKLYIFAFDKRCFEILSDMHLKNTIILSLEDIMTVSLQRLQDERTCAEFCWTCTPLVIEHVLLKRGEKVCTYIDADIYFFADPAEVIQEIVDDGCSVGLTAHSFERNSEYGRHVFDVGKYCIQFNTFFGDDKGMQVLTDWKECCLDWCYGRYWNGRYGDQKYPDKWRQKYSCVHESQNLGAGAAPWNLQKYSYEGRKDGNIWMKHKDRRFRLIFYHFEGMKYFNDGNVWLNLWYPHALGTGRKVKILYGEYFKTISSVRRFLTDSYGITFEYMEIEREVFHYQNYSLRHFCEEDGVLAGVRKWAGYWNNNIVRADRLSNRGGNAHVYAGKSQ